MARDEQHSYSRFRVLGRELLALPTDSPLSRRHIWSIVPGATWRARLMKALMAGAVALRVDWLIARRGGSPLAELSDDEWRALLDQVQRASPSVVQELALVHAGPSRPGRFYLHLFDRSGVRTGFAKMMRSDSARSLAEERSALDVMVKRAPRNFRVPSLLAEGGHRGFQWLLYRALPLDARPVPAKWSPMLEDIHREIAGPARKLATVSDYSWWRGFEARSAEAGRLRELVLAEGDNTVGAVAAHGDFVAWNVFSTGDETYVLDWESFCLDAPLLADPVRFFLGVRTRGITRSPADVAKAVHVEFCLRQRQPERALLRALAFLHERRVVEATKIACHWSAGRRR